MLKLLILTVSVFLFAEATLVKREVVRQLGVRQVDQTLVASANGVDVVDACIQKLGSISLFTNDYGFLKRLALVESTFGENTSVINAFPQGGIWQITQQIQQALNNPLLQRTIAEASSVIGSDITDLTSNDFRIPLQSAYAARLYMAFIQLTSTSSLPGTLTEQADWWRLNYRTNGDTTYFVTTVENYENANRCQVSKLDLYFLLDGSGSIGASNFQTSLQFVSQLANEFPISPDEVRTGLTVYSNKVYPISTFDQDTSNTTFSTAVLNANYPNSVTQTGKALEEVRVSEFNVSNGMRPSSEGVPRILIALTDGKSGDDVKSPSNAIREDGITIFAVGIGKGYDIDEINEIASNPDSDYAFEFSQFDQLSSILKDRVSTQACQVPIVFPDDTDVPVNVNPGDTHYSEVQMPTNGSLGLTYTCTTISSSARVYVSSSAANPSSALYDFYVDISFGVTVVTVNSGTTVSSSVELYSQTSIRSKRAVADSTQPVYVAVVNTGNVRFEGTVKSTGNTTRATGTAGLGRYNFSTMFAFILAGLAMVWTK